MRQKNKQKVVKIMTREIEKDLSVLVRRIAKAGLYLATAPVIGNLTDDVKTRIYNEDMNLDRHENEDLTDERFYARTLTRRANVISTFTNIGAAYANYSVGGAGNPTIDKLILGYAIIEGTIRTLNTTTSVFGLFGAIRDPDGCPYSYTNIKPARGSLVGLIPSKIVKYFLSKYDNAKNLEKELVK